MSRALLRCKMASTGQVLSYSAFAIVAGTLHGGGLWGCPLVYNTTIAPSQRATWRASMSRALLRCKMASTGQVLSYSAFAIVAGTLHGGGLWGCPLVYNTTIAPSQRATWRASMSRALLRCKMASTGQVLSYSAFAIVAGTLHGGGLWGCPLVYNTTIAPSQTTNKGPHGVASMYHEQSLVAQC